MAITRLNTADKDFNETLNQRRSCEAVSDAVVLKRVMDIIGGVRRRGDEAVVEFSKKFDRVKANSMSEMEFSPASIDGEPCIQVIIRHQADTKELEAKLQQLSLKDAVTCLYNRQFFLGSLDKIVNAAKKSAKKDDTKFLEELKNTQAKQMRYLTIIAMIFGVGFLGYSFVKKKETEV